MTSIFDDGKILMGGASEHNPSGNLDIVGDNNSNGPELYLRVSNNNTTDNIGALLFGNNVDKSIECIVRLLIVTLIDTPGAYPGLEAEERGQGEAIARNLKEMSVITSKLLPKPSALTRDDIKIDNLAP